MKVYHNIQEFKKIDNAVTTVGIFDGMHLGHQKIIDILLHTAKEQNTESVVVTFEPHPRLFFNPTTSQNLKIITDINEKIKLFEQYGVDNLLVIPFNEQIASLTSEQFIRQIIKDTIGTQTLFLGYDHRFGRNREGNFEYLYQKQAEFGIRVHEISKFDIDEAAVSSTRIRDYISDGDLHMATTLLGRHYTASGIVVEGRKLGRTIGFPTANINIENPYKVLPKMGVYAVAVNVDNQQYGGMLNIGLNPTVSSSNQKTTEVHIFDFDNDIYGKELTIKFLERMRDEQKFNGLQELIIQLKEDAIMAKQILSKINFFKKIDI